MLLYVLGVITGIALPICVILILKGLSFLQKKVLDKKFNQVLQNHYYREKKDSDEYPRVEDV